MFAIGLFFLVLGGLVKQCAIPAFLVTLVLTMGAAVITYLNGGNVVGGMLWTAGACAVVSLVGSVLATFIAMSRPW